MTDVISTHEEWLSRLNDHLHEQRYHFGTARHCMSAARHFLAYLRKRRIAIDDAQPETVEHYLKLVQRKYRWPPAAVAVTPFEVSRRDLCDGYAKSMVEMRGLSAETVDDRRHEACCFLDWLREVALETLTTLTVANVDAYMKHRATSLRRVSIKGVATRLRSFLRWLYANRQTTRDLSLTVIAPTLYAFESIPSALRLQDVEKILSIVRRDRTKEGVRDYAILMLLAKYGVRAGEVTGLRLDDLDRRKEIIRIRHSKTGETSYLPLLPEMGEAILKYLQKVRPKTSAREIFIRNRAPYWAFASGSSLYTPIRRRIDDAGVPAGGKRGPHAFRHARAVSMIRASVSLKEIGDLLGHRASDSALA